MKKNCIWSLLVVLALLLTGCTSVHTTDNAFSNWNEKVQADMGQTEDQWSYTLSAQHFPLHHYAEDGRLLVEGSYDLPVMEVFHADGTPYDESTEAYSEAVMVCNRFNAFFADKMAAYQADFDEVCRLARESYERGDESWQNGEYYYIDTIAASFRSNSRMVCVTMTVRTFTGGAHGVQVRVAYNFDMATGQEFTINDMAEDYVGLRDAVALEILSQIEDGRYVQYYESLGLFEGYEEVIPEWMSRTLFFGADNMKVVFGVYDIAPYSAGDVVFTIPYQMIEPYLNDYGRAMLELD